MNSMAWDPRFLFSWPNARVSVMGGEQAAKTLAQVKLAALKREGKVPGPDEVAAIKRRGAAEYDAKSDAYYATSELWDDGILDPVDTRNALGMRAVGRAQSSVRAGPLRRAADLTRSAQPPLYDPIRRIELMNDMTQPHARVQPRSPLSRDPRAGRPFRAQGIASAAAEDGRRGMVAASTCFRCSGENGYLGVTVPEELGGAGLDSFAQGLVAQAFARWNANAVLSILAHDNLCVNNLLRNASPAQQRRSTSRACARGRWSVRLA